jgi:putative YhdH/YhfP family quinone oxidoreductase
MFKAYRITQRDSRVDADFVTCTLDDLDPGSVVVRVAYSDVNYKDALAATGKGRILRRPSCIGGIDFAGTVVSSTDPRFAPDDRVVGAGFALGVSHDGGYAEFARVPGDWLITLPEGLTLWESMALGTAGLTAALAVTRMERHGLSPSRGPVVVSGATGGVGTIAIASLAHLGYDVVALTGKAEAADYLRSLGCRDVLRRDALELDRIKPLGRATWAGAIDNLGGPVLAWMASTMMMNGVVASIGLTMSPDVTLSVMPFILRGVSLLGINSSDSPTREEREEAWRRLASDLKPAGLREIATTIPFAELPPAFQRLIDGSATGRTVVEITAPSA